MKWMLFARNPGCQGWVIEGNVGVDFAVLLVYQEAAQTLLKAAEDGSLESVLRKKTGEEAPQKTDLRAVELRS